MSNRGPSYLWDTPPYCPTPECSVHGVPQQEHHVAACPMADTLAGQMHMLGHAARDACVTLEAFADAFRVIRAPSLRTRLNWVLRRLFRWRRVR